MSNGLSYNDRIEQRDKIWSECEPLLRRIYMQKLSSCPNEIDDVIHDTYIAFCDAINNGTKIYNCEKWLIGTLVHKINHKYTEINKSKKTTISLSDVETKIYYEVDFDSKRISDELTEEMAMELILSLNEQEQVLYTLIYEKHMKHKEIASILGISEGAVRERAFRLKWKIKYLAKEMTKNI